MTEEVGIAVVAILVGDLALAWAEDMLQGSGLSGAASPGCRVLSRGLRRSGGRRASLPERKYPALKDKTSWSYKHPVCSRGP